jgi:hypothetical protein
LDGKIRSERLTAEGVGVRENGLDLNVGSVIGKKTHIGGV